ncbi:transmembrane protein 241 isoform X2 [Erinaceus europaeus]|uniref:Transmembrane protein 241 isoform X2 n=1 Tax=Erinaceus europaeus TaxID=9365 RepID=A0ABM3VZ46_ERIEU|nr:transmembrane protein 241 isoform X2 [Erinaceus europaeus]
MCLRNCLVIVSFCTCFAASYLINKYVLSVLKFTYPTLFQGWQTLIGGLLLHVSWKLGWVEINRNSRSDVLTWLPASFLFVGIIYAGSRALSRLELPQFGMSVMRVIFLHIFIKDFHLLLCYCRPFSHSAAMCEVASQVAFLCISVMAIPVFLTLHNVAEVIICWHQKCFRKEKTAPVKICSALFLLAAAGCLPFNDFQFDPDGYFWAVVHFFCVGAYKILQKSQRPNALSVTLLALASHPTGDLFSILDFPFLYFYRFHSSCCASGILGFLLMFSTVKLKSLMAPGQFAAWIFFAKVITASLSVLLFDVFLTSATVGCILLGGLGEALLVFSEWKVS